MTPGSERQVGSLPTSGVDDHLNEEAYGLAAACIENYIREHTRDVHQDDVYTVERKVRGDSPTTPDYDVEGRAFTKRYLIGNFWKVSAVLNLVRAPLVGSVLDAGCGSGASALAYLAYTASRRDLPEQGVQLTLVDRSSRQLADAAQLVSAVSRELGIRASVVSLCAELGACLGGLRSRFDLSLASYVLCENPANAMALAMSISGTVIPGGVVILIDRPHDPVWQPVAQTLTTNPGGGRWTSGEAEIPRRHRVDLGETWDVSWCTKMVEEGNPESQNSGDPPAATGGSIRDTAVIAPGGPVAP